MRVLAACEISGVVRNAFRAAGHDAYSCDFQSDPSPFHLQTDVVTVLSEDWDLVISFPPCTHLSSSGARWWEEKRTDGRQGDAEAFFLRFVACAPRVAIENPVGRMSTVYREPDQVLQPWQFGHGETKATCLWLRNLPALVPTDVVEGREPRIHHMAPGPERSAKRSVTYAGIAAAMASQWGDTHYPIQLEML